MFHSRFVSAIAVLFALLFIPRAIRGNDTLATLGAGGLVPLKSSTVVMESETLHISLHRVTVDYVFRNMSNQDVDAVVAFPLPELNGAEIEVSPMELPSKDPTNFISFKLIVDGRPISPKVEIRAFKKDQDITERLKVLGLPLSVLDPRMNAAIAKLPKDQRNQIEHEDLIVNEEPHTDSKNDQSFWPWWQTRIQYYWTQHFPANRAIRVSHNYLPVVGGTYIDDDGSRIAERYCGTPVLNRIRALKDEVAQRQEPGVSLWWRSLQYILTTANNWSGPIKHFHLEIDSDTPGDILLTCMPAIKQTSRTHYELDALDFHPDRNLDVVILQAHKGQPAWPSAQ